MYVSIYGCKLSLSCVNYDYISLEGFVSSYLKSAIPNQWAISIFGDLCTKYGFYVANLYFISWTNVTVTVTVLNFIPQIVLCLFNYILLSLRI